MSAHYRCDGCGKEDAAAAVHQGYAAQPIGWAQWLVDSGTMKDACSLECMDAIMDEIHNLQRSVAAKLMSFGKTTPSGH